MHAAPERQFSPWRIRRARARTVGFSVWAGAEGAPVPASRAFPQGVREEVL